jgi:hypothetical protein
LIDAFGGAWTQAENLAPAVQQTRRDLVEMLRRDWRADAPAIHYPRGPSETPDESYRWFMDYTRPGGKCKPLPPPEAERTDPSQRLPKKP